MPRSVKGVMKEWKTGRLHSGSPNGPVVKNQKQAVAIALSEQRQRSKNMTPSLRAAHASHPNASRLGKYLHPSKKAR